MYQGMRAGLALCINPAIEFLAFERLKQQALRTTGKKYLSLAEGFALGAVAKAIATVLTFPLIRLKVS